jgi:hypothetical protein
MKIILATLLLIFLQGAAFAQDDPPEAQTGGPKCFPFDDMSQSMKADGYAPVFLGEKANVVDLVIIQNKKGNWVLLQFIATKEHPLVVCILDGGSQGVIQQPEPEPTSPETK